MTRFGLMRRAGAAAVRRDLGRTLLRRLGRRRRPAWREFVLVAGLYELYSLTRRVGAGGRDAAVANAHHLLSAEQWARLAPERWLNQVVSAHPLLGVPADYAYATLHYAVTLCVLLWLWRAHPNAYLPARRTLAAATLLGLLGFVLFPLAPPRMLPGFIDTMARFGHDGWWGGAASAPKGLAALTNQYAAMPSLHVGWAVWSGWQITRHARRRSLRALAAAYPALTVLVVMSTANHYIADAAAGLVVLLLGGLIARATAALRRPHRGTGQRLPSPRHPSGAANVVPVQARRTAVVHLDRPDRALTAHRVGGPPVGTVRGPASDMTAPPGVTTSPRHICGVCGVDRRDTAS